MTSYRWFSMFSCAISLFSRYRDGRSGAHHISPLVLCLTQDRPPLKVQSPKMVAVQSWSGRKRWGQDVLIYSACNCDLQQQSDCCGDKRKQSAAHPHTAGYCWTKEDYLDWYKKQRILFLKLKINVGNIYSKQLGRYSQSDITVIVYILFFFLLRQDNWCYL